MYFYLIPQGGLNDMLTTIDKSLNYCKLNKRTLLLNTIKPSSYNINFSDYFELPNLDVIYDTNEIKKIFNNNKLTVYPENLNLTNVINGMCFKTHSNGYEYNGNIINYSNINDIKEDIIIFASHGDGSHGYKMFKNIYFKKNIVEYCIEKHSLLKNPYLCIQVRNTDHKCCYQQYFEDNKELIFSYDCIYIATDDKDVIEFYKSKNLNIYNFTTFPDTKVGNRNLHNSNINPDIKIKDLICDIYIITMSDKLLSNSKGGFICLLKDCHNNKNIITPFNISNADYFI